jgi:hypothetical protein
MFHVEQLNKEQKRSEFYSIYRSNGSLLICQIGRTGYVSRGTLTLYISFNRAKDNLTSSINLLSA